MSDNRPYPKILRTTVEADTLLRAYAREYQIEPYEALVVAIDRLADPVEAEPLRASLDAAGKLAERLAADLESAREATRRADQEIETLRAELARGRASDEAAQEALRGDVAREIEAAKRAEKEAERLRAELAATRPAPCACAALPDDFEAKLTERAPGWPGTLPELRARVIQLGFSRYDALATDAAKRAAERAARG
jgi:hypothetical protein